VQQPHTKLYKINIMIRHVDMKLMTEVPRSLSKQPLSLYTDRNAGGVNEHEPTVSLTRSIAVIS